MEGSHAAVLFSAPEGGGASAAPLPDLQVSAAHAQCRSYRFLRIVLGGMLLVAAGLKAHQLATQPSFDTGALNSWWFVIAVVEVELLLGLVLLLGLYQRVAWVAALAFFCTASAVSLFKALAGEVSCGCFGSVGVNPWYALFFDLVLVASIAKCGVRMPLGWAIPSQKLSGRSARRQAVVAAAIASLIGLPFAIAMHSLHRVAVANPVGMEFRGDRVLLRPELWLGHSFPLNHWIDVDRDLMTGLWIVVFYHSSCPHCRQVLREYDALAVAGRLNERRVAFIELPPHDPNGAASLFSRADVFTHGQLDAGRQWLLRNLPVQCVVHDGIVERILAPTDSGTNAEQKD